VTNYYNHLNIFTFTTLNCLSTASNALIFGDFSPPGGGGRKCISNNRESKDKESEELTRNYSNVIFLEV